MEHSEIRMPGWAPKKESTFDKVIAGLDVSAKILGLGLTGTEIYQRSQQNAMKQLELNAAEATNFAPAKKVAPTLGLAGQIASDPKDPLSYEPGAIKIQGSKQFPDQFVKPTYHKTLGDQLIQMMTSQQAGANPLVQVAGVASPILKNNVKGAIGREFDPKKDSVLSSGDAYLAYKTAPQISSAQAHADNMDFRGKAQNLQTFEKAKMDLESLRGDPAIQIAKRNLLLANNALGVFKNYQGDLNQVPASLSNLFYMEEAKMASGGVPTEGELHSINDPSFAGWAQELKSKIMNQPEGAGKGQFLPIHIDYVKTLRDESTKFLKDNLERKLSPWDSKLSKGDSAMLRKANIDFLNEVQHGATVSRGADLVTISNGKETHQIPRSSLEDAMKDGFKVVQ